MPNLGDRPITIFPGQRLIITVDSMSGVPVENDNNNNNNNNDNAAGQLEETVTSFSIGGSKKGRKNSTRKNKTRKNQAGGKKGPNGYMKFAAEVRPQILKEHPELKSDVVKVARKIGEKWRALSDAEKAKY